MDALKIYSGPKIVVIASGTVIAYRGNPIEIVYGISDKRLGLTFKFIDEDGVTQTRIESNIQQGRTEEAVFNYLQFTLFNFKDQMGSGTREPIEIGNLNGHRVFLHFRVQHLMDSDKTFHYSLFHETRPAPPQGVTVS